MVRACTLGKRLAVPVCLLQSCLTTCSMIKAKFQAFGKLCGSEALAPVSSYQPPNPLHQSPLSAIGHCHTKVCDRLTFVFLLYFCMFGYDTDHYIY